LASVSFFEATLLLQVMENNGVNQNLKLEFDDGVTLWISVTSFDSITVTISNHFYFSAI